MAGQALPIPVALPKPAARPSWWLLAFGILVVVLILLSQRERAFSGRNDFVQLWVSAKLVGTPQLYNLDASNALQKQALGLVIENVSPSRPPFYAFVLKPLGWLPYLAAFWIFEILSIACLVGFVWLNLRRVPELAIFCCFALPVIANLANGQDLAFVIFFVAIALSQFERKRDFLCGLILTLCGIKFHLFLLLPLVPLIHRRWRILWGGAVGLAILLALSFLAQGPHWISDYMRVLRDPNISPGADIMPNLHGLLDTLGSSSMATEVAVCAIVALIVAYLAWREPDFELAFGWALLGGLLVSFHAYLQDCLILLPVLVAVLSKGTIPALRHLMTIATLPPVHLMLLAGGPYSAACPILMLLILVVAFGYAIRSQTKSAARHPAG
jgi:hypothetical protein